MNIAAKPAAPKPPETVANIQPAPSLDDIMSTLDMANTRTSVWPTQIW